MLKIGTTFSGIGAPEQALKNLKIPHIVKWACDIDKNAKQTYLANHVCEKYYDDITLIDTNKLEYVDLYVFGFPCQDVSVYGNQDISKGKTILVNYSLDIIDKIKPKYILFENVKGLLNNKFKTFFNNIINRLNINYNLDYKILNSKFFNIPQNRERVYCLGTRKDLKQIKLPNQNKNNLHPHISTILEKNVNEKYTLSDYEWIMCQKHKKNNIKKGYGFGFRYINDCAYTLLALSPLRSSQLIKQNNKNPRIFTERECARLQGFPENFIIHPNTNIAYKQFGNSITVNVLESIFKNLIII